MDASLIDSALPGGVAIVIALATWWLTQRRADRTEERMASRDIVDMLLQQNKSLLTETDDLRTRITTLESTHARCQEEIMDLVKTIARLRDEREHP